MKAEEMLSDEEQREATIGKALTSAAPSIPGFDAVRHVTPLVMIALQRANNPFVTAKKGFDAMGINFSDGMIDVDPSHFGVAMMEKTAEVLVLLTCDREALKHFANDRAALLDAAQDLLEDSTPENLAAAVEFVSEQLFTIAKTRVSSAPADQEAPEASTIQEGRNRPKKPARTGSRKY